MELHTRKMKVPPLAPPAPSGPAVAAWAAFEAATAAGSLRVWAHGTVRHAADAAVLLDTCAPLLDALDGWLDFALAWRWCAQGPNVGATAPHARAHWNAEAPTFDPGQGQPSHRIELPWALLRGLAPPPATLAAQLRWAMAPAVLVLAQMRLDDDELAALEPGGALLLPASMTPGWQGRLRPCDEAAGAHAGLAVALPTPWTPEPMATEAASTGEDGELCEVRLGLARPMDARSLAGWQRCEPIEAEARASLWRCAGETGPTRYLAGGELMPWGDGWAFHIESLHQA
jgi:hypothetical protein